MKTKFMRGLALFLCLSMILGFIPGSFLHVHAEEVTPDSAADSTVENEAQHPEEGSLIADGGFENVSTNWAGAWKTLCSGNGNAGVVYDVELGSNVLKVCDPNGSDDAVRSATELEGAKFPVTAGQNYDLSLKIKQDAAYADKAVGKVTLYIFWIDANGNFLDADGDGTLKDPEYYVNFALPTNAEWTDFNATVAIPAGAVSAYLRFNTFVADINCYYVDDISFVRNPTVLTNNFNGNIEALGWTKSAGASVMNYGHAVEGKSIILQTKNTTWAQSPAIAVVPGFTYTAKFMHAKTVYDGVTQSVGTGGRAKWIFVDKNGTVLEETVITVGEQNGWEEATLSSRAPANSAYAYLKFFIDDSYTGDPCFSLDNLVVTETVGEVLQPVELPMVPNGDFENGTANWKNLQLVAEAGRDGGTALLIDAVNRQKDVEMTTTIPVDAGTSYTASFWAKRAVTDTEARSITMYVFYKDADGNFLDANGDGTLQDKEYYTTVGANPAVADPAAETPTTEWQQYQMTYTAPEGTASVFYRFYASSSFADSAIYIDDLVMVKTPVPTNGDFSNGTTGWKGGLSVNEDGQAVIPIFEPNDAGKRGSAYFVTTGSYVANPGETFKLTFDAIRTANEARTGSEEDNVNKIKDSGSSYIGFWYYDAEGTCINAQAINPTADEWTEYEMLWTAPEGTATFKIEFGVNSNSGASFLFDNIKVVNVADIPPVVVAPEYPSIEEDFSAYTSTYTGWTGDYIVTTAGMKLNGTATKNIDVIAGATYKAEAEGATATLVDGVLTLTAEDAFVSNVAVYLLCSDSEDDMDHNCDICDVVIGACEYDNDCDADCNICYEWRTAPHGELTHFEAQEPVDCATPGNVEYWHCESCGENFFDAEATQMADPYRNPVTITVDCVRPEGTPDCATITCEICGNELYGYGEHDLGDAFACQGGTCLKCGDEIEGYGCQNYDGPACLPGNCYYCGEAMEPVDHENGAWAPCLDGECSYGCGLKYPATADHIDDDADGYCDTCWNHLDHSFDSFDPCYGGECSVCWTFVAGEHDWVDGVCSVCDAVCDHNGLEEGTCEICGKELVVDLTGTEAAPVQLMAPTSNVTISKAPYYYQGHFSGMNLTVTGTGDFSVIYNGQSFPAVDGIANVGTVASANPRMPVVFAIDGIGDFAINFTYPVGSMENPAQAQLGDNNASIAAGTQGYYWTYTAAEAGKLNVTISGEDNWMYVVNNLTTYQYGDNQWSDSDPVVNPTTIEVSAGDVIQVMVNGYDPANPWTAPAAELTVNLAYAPTGPILDETLSFYNVGLVLGADIRGVFQVKYKPATSPYTSFKVMIERNGVESELALTTSSGTTTVYLGYALNLSAKEMADEVTATIIGITADGTEYISNAYTWSIKQGAMAMLDERAELGTEAANKQMVLIANMLHYGAKAQQNFEYNLENLATDGLKAEYAALILNTTPEMNGFETPDETGFSIKLVGTPLNLASKVEILPQFYLPKNPVYSDYKAVVVQTHVNADGTETTKTFEIAGEDCLTSGRYLAPYINELAAAELRDTLTITLYQGDMAVSATYTFSAESACSGMLSTYPELIPALMNYGDCAKAVFG